MMCKLCNTDEPPAKDWNNKAMNESTKHFIQVVKEYTYEKPCNTCIRKYSYALRYYNNANSDNAHDIDEYLFSKLMRIHGIRIYGQKALMLSKAKTKRLADHASKKEQLKAFIAKHGDKIIKEKVGQYITKITRHTSILYSVAKSIVPAKAFKTLVEAQAFADSINHRKKGIYTKTRIERGIYASVNSNTNNISYIASAKKTYKTFKTLEDARAYRTQNVKHHRKN